ncbi:MAG TPA: hypothetical protein VH370_03775 [Humisphaera sp.]|jgi:hypothetical protein|nr:hypothetical protein [Humisphaera sp.]
MSRNRLPLLAGCLLAEVIYLASGARPGHMSRAATRPPAPISASTTVVRDPLPIERQLVEIARAQNAAANVPVAESSPVKLDSSPVKPSLRQAAPPSRNFAPRRFTAAASVASTAPPGLFGTEFLPTSGSEPPFLPGLWNSPMIRPGNNCYAYACDDFNDWRRGSDDFPQPGNTAGYPTPSHSQISADLLRSRAESDGLALVKSGSENEPAPIGFYKVALVVAPGLDYHWYRQDPNGYWSHKLGEYPIMVTDSDGNPITDPRTAAQHYERLIDPENNTPIGHNYNTFGGFFYVPEGGIRLHGAR